MAIEGPSNRQIIIAMQGPTYIERVATYRPVHMAIRMAI